MKSILIALCLFPLLGTAQNKYIVNNAPGSVANYNSLQTAINAVPSGSILYVMPSSISYGEVIIAKKLTIYGTGYFLGSNAAPNTQSNMMQVILGRIWFKPGSDSSKIEGIQLSDLNATILTSPITRIQMDSVSNITINRCFFLPIYPEFSMVVIRKTIKCSVNNCFMNLVEPGNGSSPRIIYDLGLVNSTLDFQFHNNIFSCGMQSHFGIRCDIVYPHDSITFTNNTFIGDLSQSTFANLNYFNNIFIHSWLPDPVPVNPLTIGLSYNSHNNISNSGHIFTDSVHNYQYANADSMFVYSLPGYHSTDGTWMIRDTSFAKTYGQGGIECGAYGNSTPYKLSGIPNLPYIYAMDVPAQATAPGTIQVRIKAKPSN